MANKKVLSKEGREDLALALILLKDFKSDGKVDLDLTKYIIELVDYLGVMKEFEKLMPAIPPLKITERYPT